MNRVAIFSAILLGGLAAAQTLSPDAEGMPPLRGVYFHSPAGWLGLSSNPLMPMENGSAKWLLGFGRGDAIADFAGPHAAVQTSQTKPTFYLRGFSPTNTIYLVREIQKAERREIHMAVSGNFIEWAHLKSSDVIPIDTRHAGGNVTALTPRDELKAGQYGIVTSFDPNVEAIRVIFDFGVNPQAGDLCENQGTIPEARAAAPEKQTGRLEAFSDGVFAIAMTLLVLELKVPHFEGAPTAGMLGSGLARDWPGYFAFVTSFFTVLIMWIHHHVIFRMVRGVDARLLFANGFLLLVVTGVPFPTAVIAEYLLTPAARVAAAFYAGYFVLVSLSFLVLRTTAFRPAVLDPEAPAKRIEGLRRSYWLGPPMYLLATASAIVSPWAAMGVCTGLWLYWAVTTREC